MISGGGLTQFHESHVQPSVAQQNIVFFTFLELFDALVISAYASAHSSVFSGFSSASVVCTYIVPHVEIMRISVPLGFPAWNGYNTSSTHYAQIKGTIICWLSV